MAQVFLGLGSNLGSAWGDPHSTLLAARKALGAWPGTRVGGCSRVYRSEAVGPGPQPDYANAVVEIDSEAPPETLLALAQGLERRFGRRRDTRWGPRSLDVDLLLVGDLVRRDRRLVLPHPRLGERRFVLMPLAELAPGLRIPGLERSVEELLAGLTDPGWVRPWEAGAA